MDEKEKERLQQLYNKIRASGELDNPAVRPIIQKAIEKGLLVDKNFGKPRPSPAPVPGDPTLGRMAPGNTLAKKSTYPSPLKQAPLQTEDIAADNPLERSVNAKLKSAVGFLKNVRDDIPATVENAAKGIGAIAAGVPMGLAMGVVNAKSAAGFAAEAKRAVERGDWKQAEQYLKMAEDYDLESKSQGQFLGDMAKGMMGGETGFVAKTSAWIQHERNARNTDNPPEVRAREAALAAKLRKDIPQGVADAFYENPVQSTLNVVGAVAPLVRGAMEAGIAAKGGSANYAARAAKIAGKLGNEEGAARMVQRAEGLTDSAIRAKKTLAGFNTIDNTIQGMGIPELFKFADKGLGRIPLYEAAKAGVKRAATLPIELPGNFAGKSGVARKLGGKVFSARTASEFMDLADPAYRSQQFNKAITDVLADQAQRAAYGVKYKQKGETPPTPEAPGLPAPEAPTGAAEAAATPPAPDTPLPESRLIGGPPATQIGRQVDLPGIDLPTDRPQVDVTLEQIDEAGNPIPVRTSQQSEANRIGAEPLDLAAMRKAEEAAPVPETLTDPTRQPEATAPVETPVPVERPPLTPQAEAALATYRESLRSTDTEALLPLVEKHAQDPAREPLLGAVVDELGRRGFTDEEIAAYAPKSTEQPAPTTTPPPVDLTTPLAEAIAPPKELRAWVEKNRPEALQQPQSEAPANQGEASELSQPQQDGQAAATEVQSTPPGAAVKQKEKPTSVYDTPEWKAHNKIVVELNGMKDESYKKLIELRSDPVRTSELIERFQLSYKAPHEQVEALRRILGQNPDSSTLVKWRRYIEPIRQHKDDLGIPNKVISDADLEISGLENQRLQDIETHRKSFSSAMNRLITTDEGRGGYLRDMFEGEDRPEGRSAVTIENRLFRHALDLPDWWDAFKSQQSKSKELLINSHLIDSVDKRLNSLRSGSGVPETAPKPSLADRFGTGAAAASIIPLNLDSPLLAMGGVAAAAVLLATARHAPAMVKKLHAKLDSKIAEYSAPARRYDELMSQYIEARLPTDLADSVDRTPEEIGRIRQEILDTIEREFENKDPNAALSVGAEFMQIGDRIVEVMDTLGQELVNAGLIDKASYDANAGFYLRRIYEYWENPEGYLEKAEAELKASGVSDLQTQAILNARERYFQDIKGRPIGDAEKVGTAPSGRRAKKAFTQREELTVEQLDMLREIAPASIRVRRGGEITGREISKAELVSAVREKFAIAPARANEIREAALQNPEPPPGFLQNKMEEMLYRYENQWTRVEANDGLVGLGRWVPVEGGAPQWEGMEIPLTIHKSLTEADWKPTTLGQKLLYLWKAGVTAFNPKAYLGNIYGNALISYLGGGLKAFNPITLARAMDSIKNRDEMFQTAMLHSDHPFESMRLEISTRKHLDPDIQYPTNLKNWIRKEGSALKDWTTDMYGGIDTVFKHALFINTMETLEKIDPRMTHDQRASQAGQLVAQSFPNFRHGTPIKPLRSSVKWARRGLFPFIAWDASAIPIVAHAFMEHPHRMAMFPLLYKGYQEAIQQFVDKHGMHDQYEEEKRLLPSYIKHTGIRLPMSAKLDDAGNPIAANYLSVAAFNPLSGITEMEGVGGPLQYLISRTNPVISTLVQLHGNERLGTQMPIKNPAAPEDEQIADSAKFAGENLIPGYRTVQDIKTMVTGKSPYPLRRDGEDGDTYTYDMNRRERIEKATQMVRMGTKTVDLERVGRANRLDLSETRKDIGAAIRKALKEAEAQKGRPLTEAEQDAVAERYIKTFEAARQAKMGGD